MDAPASKSGNTKTRVVTGLAIVAGFLAAITLAPDELWSTLMVALAAAGAWEWARLIKLPASAWQAYTGMTALAAAALAAFSLYQSPYIYLPALAFWVVVAPYWLNRTMHLGNRVALAVLGWLILLPGCLGMIRLRSESPELLLAVLGIVAVADSAAYFTGRRFGRRKLAPHISPGKTWEGAIGAWLAVTAYGLAVHFLWPQTCGFQCLPQVLAAFWALFGLSVLGDLFESWIKREAGVKDSGNLLPGHGGVLDRIDSHLAVLPAAVLFWMWLK